MRISINIYDFLKLFIDMHVDESTHAHCIEHKQKEVAELSLVTGQKSWEREEAIVLLMGFSTLGKLVKIKIRGEGRVGFLVWERLLVDFNARVGRSNNVDEVIGIFGEETCNASGNKLVSFLDEVELVICNGRQLVLEPEWTRVRPGLDQKSVRDFIVMNVQLIRESGEVHVNLTGIGMSDHFLVWLELGKVVKCYRKPIMKWHLDGFFQEGVKRKYCQDFNEEIESFQRVIGEW